MGFVDLRCVKVEYFYGEEGISLFHDMLIRKNTEVLTFEGSGKTFSYYSKQVLDFVQRRINRGIFNRVICPIDNHYNITSKKELREVKHINSNNHKFGGAIAIVKDLVGIYSLKKDQKAVIVIENQEVGYYFTKIFNLFWECLSNQKK
jgi:muramoyltetrapeptide carboxypeptidase LdcA involved in peptidoglycan recycling